MPALTYYGTSIADSILTTACQMATNSGGTETSKLTTIPSTSNPYAEILSQGGSSTAVAALPSPTGHGYIFYPGAGSFAAGTWTLLVTKSSATKGVSSTFRVYKISSGVYTSVGSATVTNSSTAKTTYTFSISGSGVSTGSSDGIYIDGFHFNNNANAGTDNPTIYVGNSATAGVAGDMQLTTPTFTPAATTFSRTVPTSFVLQSPQLARVVPTGFVLQSSQNPRVVPTTFALQSLGKQRIVPTSFSLANTFSRIIPTSFVLNQPSSRTVPTSFVLKSIGNVRIIPTGFVLTRSLSRIVPTGFVLAATNSRIVPTSFALTVEIASGGFALFGNTTSGTVSFDSVRFTQYPDPALPLNRVLDRLGSSSASWNTVTPAGTSATVKTSTDGIHFSTATNGASVAGLTGQPDPIIDIFDGDGTATYTNTCKSGGSVAAATLDTANKRLTLAGGSGAVYLNATISDDDIDLICDMDMSDAGGLVWRFVDSSNYYELGAYDDSASGGFTNQLRLYKVLAGTRTLLGSASAVTWYRSTPGTSPYKRIRVTMLAGVISVYFDGTLMQTYTDVSPLASGKCGLRNDTGTSRYYQLRIQQQGDYVSGTPAGDIVTGKFVYTEQDLSTTDPSTGPQVLDVTTSARSPKITTGALIPALHDPTLPFAEYFNKEYDTIAQASGDVHWNVDKVGELTMSERNATPAPFCIHSSDLLFNPQVQPTSASDLYRNQMIITNTIGITDVVHEEKVSDGSATSWNMAYPLYSAPEIVVGGVVKTVGQQGVDPSGSKDFYWQAGSNSIGQDDSADKLPAGYILEFDYIGQYPDQVTRNNLAEQAARRAVEGGSGIVCVIEDGKGMLSSNAIVYADGKLARHSNNDTVEIVATTERSGLESGMVAPHFVPEHHLQNRQLLITKVTRTGFMQGDGTTRYRYAYTATDGPNTSNWSEAIFG